MKPLIEEALKREANKVVDNLPVWAEKKTIEAAHARKTAILNIVVTMVFSDTQKEKCSRYNDDLSENAVIKKFRCENSPNKNAIMIVVDKLLTGFDEPTIHTIFINKNMSGIALFQAVCRINRTHPNKKNCLVVDMSHDNKVARDIPAVFEEYGDITTGDFDAFTLQQKMNKSFNGLFNYNKEVAEQFKLWKAWNDDKKKELPVELLNAINSLFEGSKADLEKAFSIWKNCSQWLGIYRKLAPLIDFTHPSLVKHTDPEKHQFVELLRRTLYTKIQEHQQDDKTGEIKFDVVKVEETFGVDFDDDVDDEDDVEPEDKKKTGEHGGERKRSDKTGIPCIDGVEFINQLNLNEEAKERCFTAIRICLIAIFTKMDEIGRNKNNDSYRKKIQSGEHIDWDEELSIFRQIYSMATSGSSKRKLMKDFSLFLELDASFTSKPSMICAEYKAWLLGESVLRVEGLEDNEV
jgi:type I restriction enzyme R subunit